MGRRRNIRECYAEMVDRKSSTGTGTVSPVPPSRSSLLSENSFTIRAGLVLLLDLCRNTKITAPDDFTDKERVTLGERATRRVAE